MVLPIDERESLWEEQDGEEGGGRRGEKKGKVAK
jgi:hypothetical protein